MSVEIPSEPPLTPLPEAVRETARQALDRGKDSAHTAASTKGFVGVVGEVAKDVADATKDAAHRAADAAKEAYQSAALRAGDTLSTSKEFVRRNPAPVLMAAIAFANSGSP